MLRYRIAKDPRGRYFVLPAMVGIVPLEETYTNRSMARQTADWCNAVDEHHRPPSIKAAATRQR
jgi:hypothetical protein